MNDNDNAANTTPSPAAADPWAGAGGAEATAAPAAAATPATPATTEAPADAWAATAEAPAAAGGDAWSSTGDAPAAASGAGGSDWLSAPAEAPEQAGFHLSQLWDGSLPVGGWINDGLAWFVEHTRPFFQAVRGPIDGTLSGVEGALQAMPAPLMIALLGLIAWQCAGRAVAIGSVVSLLLVAVLGIWSEAMVTLALVLTSLVFCLAIGLPLGIALASSDRAQRIVRPLLDAMQTTPAFVYLVPVVMLFGIGNVPGVIVTIVFALPPLVRLTTLGIRQVRPDLVEAARSYGASPWQLLTKVQLPLAMPSIMAGVNQALMLSLSMVVIASMIAVGGLGQMVLRGIGRLDMGLATVGGLGIVLLAIMLDRITQAMGHPRRENGKGARHWWQTGPVGLVANLLAPRANAAEPAKATEPSKAAKAAVQPAPQQAAALPARS